MADDPTNSKRHDLLLQELTSLGGGLTTLAVLLRAPQTKQSRDIIKRMLSNLVEEGAIERALIAVEELEKIDKGSAPKP